MDEKKKWDTFEIASVVLVAIVLIVVSGAVGYTIGFGKVEEKVTEARTKNTEWCEARLATVRSYSRVEGHTEGFEKGLQRGREIWRDIECVSVPESICDEEAAYRRGMRDEKNHRLQMDQKEAAYGGKVVWTIPGPCTNVRDLIDRALKNEPITRFNVMDGLAFSKWSEWADTQVIPGTIYQIGDYVQTGTSGAKMTFELQFICEESDLGI